MKVVQVAILGKISGNVNADEVIGTRVTLKKMYSSGGEVLPFVSARAVKYAIREALRNRGFEVDPFISNPKATDALRLADTGDPNRYVDNDLFGYMSTKGRGKTAEKRQAPVALSYFKAIKDTPIKSEFGARFPRQWAGKGEDNPVPFEVEIAEFIGKLNCVMYDYIGKFDNGSLDVEERTKRIRNFAEILLQPAYVLPRRTNSLNIPEYIASLVVLSENGPLPIYQHLDYDFENNFVSLENLSMMATRDEIVTKAKKIMFIDYKGSTVELPTQIERSTVGKVVDEIAEFL
ncbi:MAG: type I-B CRISPR-associated protein Cas7/Cst2/DevR [Candidatus Micrarchaeaceae archaeon]|nr:type I-B CRISPR-associated protein Cas7/Cst2/DevR [Candidatus Jingweiarchaeum tengchongense]